MLKLTQFLLLAAAELRLAFFYMPFVDQERLFFLSTDVHTHVWPHECARTSDITL